ncbi:hypothetical protein [Promicromonospora sp. MEB111]|uniref:hypothetical protein n=1 Tax=Promicromonospora sp. MEB111 TaxID=3040301 RepID=UPI00254E8837|nr:hypothetical protein [Promicromonospora sp. MEB111]
MSLGELVDLCEHRIDELSRRRQGFEHLDVPEYVEILVGDLRVAASDWEPAVGHLPGGSPAEVRGRARAVRDAATSLRTMGTALRGRAGTVSGTRGLDAVADTFDGYAAALESGRTLHTTGVARLRVARHLAAGLSSVGGSAEPDEVDALSRSAIAVVDAACAGYAACRDAYQAVLDAEEVLRRALAHLPGAQVTR